MTKKQALEMAKKLLASYGGSGFDISMPDQEGYDLMRSTLSQLGRASGPDGEFFIVRVYPQPGFKEI